MWRLVTIPICKKVARLIEESTTSSAAATTPQVRLAHEKYKVDLAEVGTEVTFAARLVNRGDGLAASIDVQGDGDASISKLRIVDPHEPFELPADSDQPVTIGLTLSAPVKSLQVRLRWTCRTLLGEIHVDRQTIEIRQQQRTPDWQRFLVRPPYTINPVKTRDRLFGRDDILARLTLNAAAQNSTFLWGQKRVGKTSVLQVLANELRGRPQFTCCFLPNGRGKVASRRATGPPNSVANRHRARRA